MRVHAGSRPPHVLQLARGDLIECGTHVACLYPKRQAMADAVTFTDVIADHCVIEITQASQQVNEVLASMNGCA